jgi:hypothetical protein
MKNDEIGRERLLPLSSMKDYKVAKDNLNVLGWRVVGADGESLGIVKDLIVDPQLMKVRYLSVVADRRFFNTDTDQYMLLPIGVAALDKSGKKVFVSSIDSKSIASYPIYDGGAISADYEYAIRDNIINSQRESMPDTSERYRTEFDDAVSHNTTGTRHISDDFYENDTYNENRFYASDEEVHRDKTYPTATREYERTDTTDDLYNDDKRPKTVEDSIATIERLEHLRERGSITEEEFILLKKRALNL